MAHKHRFKLASWQYPPAIKNLTKEEWPKLTFCCKCGERQERPMTKEEIREYRAKWKECAKDTKELHKVWHKFVSKFGSPKGWKLQGYDFMYAVEQYEKRNPEITVVGCDDAHFASSSIVLIPHKSQKRYMGTTMLIIPQLVGEITQVFLYPGHADALIEALRTLPKGEKPDWEKLHKRSVGRLKKLYLKEKN